MTTKGELIKKTSETKITPGLQGQTLFGQTLTELYRILISGECYILSTKITFLLMFLSSVLTQENQQTDRETTKGQTTGTRSSFFISSFFIHFLCFFLSAYSLFIVYSTNKNESQDQYSILYSLYWDPHSSLTLSLSLSSLALSYGAVR